jgi:hypothetical protein
VDLNIVPWVWNAFRGEQLNRKATPMEPRTPFVAIRSLLVTLVALLVVAATAACGGSGGDSAGDDSSSRRSTTTTTASSTTSTTAGPPPTTGVAADGVPVIPVEHHTYERVELQSPDWLAADEQFLYVKLDRGAVVRLDPATLEEQGTTEIGGDLCQGIGVGFGAVWTCRGSDVVRVDPESDEVVATVRVGKADEQGHLATGFGRVWVLVGDGSSLVGIDPETDEADEPIELDVRGSDLAVDGTGVWIASRPDDQVIRLDPATGTVTARVPVADPQSVDTAAGIWVGAGQSTVRIDPATMQVVTTVPSGPGGEGGVAADADQVWIRNPDWLLRRANATDGVVTEEIAAADVTSGGSVLVAFDAVWATGFDDGVLYKVTVTP